MSYFLIGSDQNIDGTLSLYFLLFQIFGIAKKNGCAEFIIQETALNVSALGYNRSWVKANEISGHDSKLFHIFLCFHRLVQDGFHGVIGTLGIAVLSVYMNRCVLQLEGCVVYLAGFGVNLAVLCLRIVGVHAADVGQLQTSIVHDLANHTAQGVHVRSQNYCIFVVLAAQLYENCAFLCNLRFITKLFEFFFHKLCCHMRETAWAWHCKQILCCFHNVICVFPHDFISCFSNIKHFF